MKEFSKEIINIDGEDYTLFLNRKGVIAWEKFCKSENEKVKQMKDKYKDLMKERTEINDNTNPFEDISDELLDSLDKDQELVSVLYVRLYWILLYTEHKLPISKVEELYKKASEEYGEDKLVELAIQMVEDANSERKAKDTKELKNLTALRPRKN